MLINNIDELSIHAKTTNWKARVGKDQALEKYAVTSQMNVPNLMKFPFFFSPGIV